MNALFSVTCRAVLRRRTAAFIMVLTVAVGVCAAVVLQGLARRQERERQRVCEETVITCAVTDVNGGRRDSLGLPDTVLARLLGRNDPEGNRFPEVIEHVRAITEFPIDLPAQSIVAGILTVDSDTGLTEAEGGKVTFYDGWDESALLTDRRLCLIPEGMQTEMRDGVEVVHVVSEAFDTDLRVIGTYRGGSGRLYCPFYIRWRDDETSLRFAKNCSFDIRDNSQLEETKQRLFGYFVEASVDREFDGTRYGIVVQDELYRTTLERIDENLRTLRVLLPVLLALFCALGFFVSSLSTRGRRREFAVMRCLGMKRGRIFGLIFSEQLLLAIPSALLGLLCGAAFGGLSRRALGSAALLLVLFLAGTAVSVLRVTDVSVMKLMKSEEE